MFQNNIRLVHRCRCLLLLLCFSSRFSLLVVVVVVVVVLAVVDVDVVDISCRITSIHLSYPLLAKAKKTQQQSISREGAKNDNPVVQFYYLSSNIH